MEGRRQADSLEWRVPEGCGLSMPLWEPGGEGQAALPAPWLPRLMSLTGQMMMILR